MGTKLKIKGYYFSIVLVVREYTIHNRLGLIENVSNNY